MMKQPASPPKKVGFKLLKMEGLVKPYLSQNLLALTTTSLFSANEFNVVSFDF